MKYYCSKCGAELMRGSRYCPSCGAQIIGVAGTTEEKKTSGSGGAPSGKDKNSDSPKEVHKFEYVPGEDEYDSYDDERRSGGILTIFLGAVVAATALFFLLVFMRSRSMFGLGGGSSSHVMTAPQETVQQGTPEPESPSGENEPAPAPAEETQEEPAEEEEPVEQPAEEEEEEEESEEEREARRQEEEENRKREEEERRAAARDLGDSDYILRESNSRYYTEEELQTLDDRSVILAINEIYARRGRKFAMQEYREYFESKSWYHGTIEPAEFDAMGSSAFNEYENANRLLLIKIAEERGLR